MYDYCRFLAHIAWYGLISEKFCGTLCRPNTRGIGQFLLTAPANGWFAYRIQVAKATTSAASYVSLFNQTAVTSLVLQGNIQGNGILRGYIPANKGDVAIVTYAYRTNDTDDYPVFVYATGSYND